MSIRTLLDLSHLVSLLGHEPVWESAPTQGVRLSKSGHAPVHVVGRTGSLPWFATESSRPESTAVALAGRFNRQGRVCLVFGFDPESRRLALAVGFGRIPHIQLDLPSPANDALNSISKLAHQPEGGSMAFVAFAAEALSTEPVSRRFFREFRATLTQVAAGFPGPMHRDDRHGLALLQLTRVLFLYFIQTKGWLGARDRFLAEEVDRCLARGRHLHRDLLKPLFFGTLNTASALRGRTARSFGPIPFLNGGLFEPHPLERKYRATIPNEIWRQAFDQLFERFHFTVSEQAGTGVRPDMLGRVFEGVMSPDVRHASGTFYTPLSLVHQVLEAGLIALIAERLHCTDARAEQLLEEGHPSAIQILRGLTLVDPAVGSGAFLLAALDRLSSLEKGARYRSDAKRYVLTHNLFGVDQSSAAVRLTELRLWLAVISEDAAERVERVAPLPNLDCLIRQGDSLFDPLGWSSEMQVQHTELIHKLAQLRRQTVVASGPTKSGLVRQLRQLEAQALDESLSQAEERHRQEVAECLQNARSHDLFDEPGGLDRKCRTQLQHLRTGLRQVRHARRKLSQEGEVPWFHYQSHFADVFAAGGFDIVTGNPPWLRSEALTPELRQRLAGRYHWWRSSSRRFGQGPDLAVAFLERAFELAAPSGVVAMLVPAKLMTAGYGAATRHALASTMTLHAVADLSRSPAAHFDATVYPLAVIGGRAAPPPLHQVRTTLLCEGGSRIRQSGLRGGAPWSLVHDRVTQAAHAAKRGHPSLGDAVVCHLGVKTGANRIFLNPPEELEPEVVRPAIRGRDLAAFRWKSRTLLLWTHDELGSPRIHFPARAKSYVDAHHAELQARTDFRGGAPWALFRVKPALAPYRVVWADLSRSLVAIALTRPSDREHIPLNSCYLAPTSSAADAEHIAAWLNSSWIRALARLAAVPAAGGFCRFNARVIGQLPLPSAALSDERLSLINAKGRAGGVVQEELDDIVAQHLGLSTAAQRALRTVVDGSA